jgi:GMP synthase (glutamine-hydrolysing)
VKNYERSVALLKPVVPVVNVKGQYNHLIVRMLTELGAESSLAPLSMSISELEEICFNGLVAGGGPHSVYQENSRRELSNLEHLIKESSKPMLCICVSHQLLAEALGGRTGPAKEPEYGQITVQVDEEDEILRGTGPSFTAWASHNDEVVSMPDGFERLAHSQNCKIEAMRSRDKPIYGVQFHPEVWHTTKGRTIFRNFIEIAEKNAASER